MYQYAENKVSIHNYFAVLLVITCFDCCFSYLEYDVYNSRGKRALPLTFFSVLFTAFRNTLARLIVLLLSLGYGIIMNVLNRYSTKICMLSFLYFIGCAINSSCYYIN